MLVCETASDLLAEILQKIMLDVLDALHLVSEQLNVRLLSSMTSAKLVWSPEQFVSYG